MSTTGTAASNVRSHDGSTIEFERSGAGPALILVDAAGHYRDFSSFGGLIGLLAADFTVYHYDRRGRGHSTDTAPYGVEREVDDLAALIDEAGGSAFLYEGLAKRLAKLGTPGLSRVGGEVIRYSGRLRVPKLSQVTSRSCSAIQYAHATTWPPRRVRGTAPNHRLSNPG